MIRTMNQLASSLAMHFYYYTNQYHMHIKKGASTHESESRGQEEAGRTQ